MTVEQLRVLVLLVFGALHPNEPGAGDELLASAAIATAAAEDLAQGYVDAPLEAATAAYWAWRESRVRLRAVNDTGRSFGLFQQGATCGQASALEQARCWLHLVHEGRRLCPAPAPATVIVWGGCHGRDVLTGRDVAELAAEREARAEELLEDALEEVEEP